MLTPSWNKARRRREAKNLAAFNAKRAPDGMRQVSLIKRVGGGPLQKFVFRWTPGDERAVYTAIHETPELDDCDVAALMHQAMCAHEMGGAQ